MATKKKLAKKKEKIIIIEDFQKGYVPRFTDGYEVVQNIFEIILQ